MIHNGAQLEGKPIEASLEDMLEANRLVEKENHNPFGKNPHKINATLDDRAIAALYVAMSYDGDAESIAEYQDKFVVVIKHTSK